MLYIVFGTAAGILEEIFRIKSHLEVLLPLMVLLSFLLASYAYIKSQKKYIKVFSLILMIALSYIVDYTFCFFVQYDSLTYYQHIYLALSLRILMIATVLFLEKRSTLA